MKKMNNKGFTLIEVLAVIVILSVLTAIMVPSVNYIINMNKENNYEDLKAGIVSASKIYLSDNRYEVTLSYGDELCGAGETEENIASIAGVSLIESKLPIKLLVDSNDLSTNSEGNITDPRNKEKILDLDSSFDNPEYSYVLVKYQCSSKDYKYTLEDDYLIWLD